VRLKITPFLAIIVLSAFAYPLLSNYQIPAKPVTTTAKAGTNKDGMPDMPMLPQMRQGGLWRTDGGFQSTFMLKSILVIAPIPVTPILFMADGTEYDLPQVQMDVAGTAMVNINNALQAAPANIQEHMSTYGSAALKFSWSHPIAVYTSILISDDVRSLSYMTHLDGDDTETNGPNAVQTQRLIEGLWWKQESDVTGFLSLTNTSSKTVPATLQVLSADAASVATTQAVLSPHNTRLIDLRSMWAQLPEGTAQGGLRISFTGSLDAIVAEGGMEQEQKGYSAMLHFVTKKVSQETGMSISSTPVSTTSASESQTTALDSPGMMMGTQDADMLFPQGTQFAPYVVMRNLTKQPMQVALAANVTQQGSPIDIPLGGVSLGPDASQQVDIKTMLSVAGLGTLNGLLNLRASFTGNPGDLMEETGSVDQSLTYVFEVPARTERWSHSKIIDVWNTATDTDTMINLWNYSNKDEDLILTFFHHTGQYQLPIHLAAHASLAMSVASLIKSGTPDAQGRRIPTNTVLGSAKISGVNGDRTHIDVAANVGIFNVRTGTCHYALITCAGVCGGWATPDPMDLDGISDFDDVSAIIQFFDGHCEDVTADEDFSPDNDEIATVACVFCGIAKVTGEGVGTTFVTSSDNYQGYNPHDHVCSDDCPNVHVDFVAGVKVHPVIDGIDTSARLWFFGSGISPSGYSTSETLTANTEGFTNGTYAWTLTDGTSKIALANGTSADTATDTTTMGLSSISYSTSANDSAVQLLYTTPDGTLETIVSVSLDVDSPYQFTSAGANINSGVAAGTDPCPTQAVTVGTAGYVTFVLYNIKSFFGVTISNISGYEAFGTRTNITTNNWPSPATAGSFTSSTGQLADCLLGNGPSLSPTTLPPQSPLLSTIIYQIDQSWHVGSTGPTPNPGLLMQTNSSAYYRDHGDHLNLSRGR